MRLSVVIPAYNEEKRIGESLNHVFKYLGRQSYESEVIVVDDGSIDSTATIVREKFPRATIISYTPNRGKGHAVRAGILAAKGAHRIFYDADGSTPIDEVEKFWPEFDRGAHVVIGSRDMPESDVQVHQAWYRENMGRIFNRLVRLVAVTGMPDTQCGFKGFTAECCAIIFPRQTIERFSFDVELLYIARRHGLKIAQVPVRWINCPLTRVNAIRDSARMIVDLFAIRWRDWKGAYK